MTTPKTLRDEFAMAALTGLLASPSLATRNSREIAGMAYFVADAMLLARKRETEE